MPDDFDPLSPERVDESIEYIAANEQSLMPPRLQVDPSARVIRGLRGVYQSEYQKHQQQLQRVEQRLLARMAHQ